MFVALLRRACEIVTLMDSGAHLTPEGLAKIRDLNKSLNKRIIKDE